MTHPIPKVASLIAFNDEGFFLAAATSAEVFANRADELVVAVDGDVNAMLVAGKDSSSRRLAVTIMLCKC